jgi:hypothetical protein
MNAEANMTTQAKAHEGSADGVLNVPGPASQDPATLIKQLRCAENIDALTYWTGADGLFAVAADVIERLSSPDSEAK